MSHDEHHDDRPFSLRVWAGMLPFFRPYRGKLVQISLLMFFCSIVDVW